MICLKIEKIPPDIPKIHKGPPYDFEKLMSTFLQYQDIGCLIMDQKMAKHEIYYPSLSFILRTRKLILHLMSNYLKIYIKKRIIRMRRMFSIIIKYLPGCSDSNWDNYYGENPRKMAPFCM